MDGAALLWPMEDVVARGSEHSTLSVPVHEAAARLKIDVSPDPYPEQVLFIRTDQYLFVKQGIPAVSLSSGKKSSNPKVKPEEIRATWIATRYQNIVAQRNDKPAWNAGDFFGEHFAKNKN